MSNRFLVRVLLLALCLILLCLVVNELRSTYWMFLRGRSNKMYLDNLWMTRIMGGRIQSQVEAIKSPQDVGDSVLSIHTTPSTPNIKVADARVHLFSAVGVENLKMKSKNKKKGKHTSERTAKNGQWQILLSGWEAKVIKETTYTCCFLLKNSSVVSLRRDEKRNWAYLGRAALQAKQYVCTFHFDPNIIKGITIVVKNGTACSTNSEAYLQPSFPPKLHRSEIAVCSKLAYGSLDANRVLEWFEAHRLFGVTKVVAYLHELNDDARKVFYYYQKLGIAELLEFYLPENDKYKRQVGTKNMLSWNDEQVVAFDCQARLYRYSYVAVVDTDEFVVPVGVQFNNSWHALFDKTFRKKRWIGSLTFKAKIHVTSWGVSNDASRLFIGQYSNTTAEMFDRSKNIYMPSKVVPGSVSTHIARPKPGYKRFVIQPHDALLHHYRSCRPEWLRKRNIKHNDLRQVHIYRFRSPLKCYDYIRYHSDIMVELAANISDRVIAVRKELGIQFDGT